MKKLFLIGVLWVLLCGYKAMADTNVWLEISHGQYASTNYVAVTVYYPTNFINWRLETATDLRGDFWRGLQPVDIISIEVSPYGVIPRWKKFFIRPTAIGPQFFRAKGIMN